MSNANRAVARFQGLTHEVAKFDGKGRKQILVRAHRHGDEWWRTRFADLVEKRRAE